MYVIINIGKIEKDVNDMKDKILVKIVVPEVEFTFDVYLPINKKIGTIKKKLLDAFLDETDGQFNKETVKMLDQESGIEYANNSYLFETNIKNGSTIIFV